MMLTKYYVSHNTPSLNLNGLTCDQDLLLRIINRDLYKVMVTMEGDKFVLPGGELI